MTYITAHLPKLEDLKKQLEEDPDKLRIYAKYMGYEGSSESMDYLSEKLKEYSEAKKSEK
jgi:ABC-type proline/glycine betaine transport system substrate-binding protein